MPKTIKKSLQRYLLKLKTPPPPLQLPSKKWILSGCKHPRTPSFALDNIKPKKKDDEATLADIDRFLHENFKSLYLDDHHTAANNSNNNLVVSEEDAQKLGPLFDSSGRFDEPSHDVFDANTTTGDEGSSSTTTTTTMISSPASDQEGQPPLPDNCVVVLLSSAAPYQDFRRSMEGMMEARVKNRKRVDWDFVEELLFCHINLNQKKYHRFILSAFVDMVTAMRRQPEENAPPKPKPRSVRTVRIGREVRKKTKEVTLEFESL